MIVSCPSCKTKYQLEESRFGEATSKRLRCTRCETVFEVARPTLPGGTKGRVTAAGAAAGADATSGVEEAAPGRNGALPPLPPLPPGKRYSLAVIIGANAGQIHAVTQPRVVLGRGDESDIQLNDSEVSRRHAMLEVHGDEAVLTDLGSTNGSYVNALRVQRATLGNNQEFALGATTLMFIVTDAHGGASE